jgi:hydroxyethylthiazole kinase-like uncharacterized protein yjeF
MTDSFDEHTLKLPPIVKNRHKYEAGYVVGLSGSDLFRGAPQLSGLAALRAGAGIVRVFHLDDIGSYPMELICQKWDENSWKKELKRADALFLGPGLRVFPISLSEIEIPSVVDADLLQPNVSFPKKAILTPHRGEMLRLLGRQKFSNDEEMISLCQQFASSKKIVLVLKGFPTIVFTAEKKPLVIARGDPGMATAGSGDVLTGILAALLAQKMSCYEAAILGVYLHALAGERAAQDKTSYSLIASDLIDYLPQAFRHLMKKN